MAEALLSPDESASLVQRILAGDVSAEEEFATIFAVPVHEMGLMRTRDADAARDLVQETLVAALVALRAGQLRHSESLVSFVYGIAHNLIGRHWREKRRSRAERPLPIDGGPAAFSDDEVERAERAELVRGALARLEDADRQVLLMTLVENLAPREIARRLGLRADAVRKRKSRALARILALVSPRSRR